MATAGKPISAMTVQELLGRPLNDVEEKLAPETLFFKGTIKPPLPGPRVSIVGSRKASSEGLYDATDISKILAEKEVIIVSGLAEGIDTSAHEAAMKAGGKTIAVLGTPLDKTYPKKNHWLQQEIMNRYLAISQFQIGHQTTPKDFVARNRTMALISDATIIIEAGELSGSRHQGWEAIRLGRPLFIWKSILNNTQLKWPEEMLRYGAIELYDPTDVLESIPSSLEMLSILS
ncbi:MAG: DNA-processing protein DprA [Nitrososphaeraceae archaeon]